MGDSKITGCRTNDKENVIKVEKILVDTAFVMYAVAAIGLKNCKHETKDTLWVPR